MPTAEDVKAKSEEVASLRQQVRAAKRAASVEGDSETNADKLAKFAKEEAKLKAELASYGVEPETAPAAAPPPPPATPPAPPLADDGDDESSDDETFGL